MNIRNTGTYGMLLCSKESANKVQYEKTNYYKLQTAMINSFWEHKTFLSFNTVRVKATNLEIYTCKIIQSFNS